MERALFDRRKLRMSTDRETLGTYLSASTDRDTLGPCLQLMDLSATCCRLILFCFAVGVSVTCRKLLVLSLVL
jgi:hypothetical protein